MYKKIFLIILLILSAFVFLYLPEKIKFFHVLLFFTSMGLILRELFKKNTTK